MLGSIFCVSYMIIFPFWKVVLDLLLVAFKICSSYRNRVIRLWIIDIFANMHAPLPFCKVGHLFLEDPTSLMEFYI